MKQAELIGLRGNVKKGVTLLSNSEPYTIIWCRHLKGKRFACLINTPYIGTIFSTGKYLAQNVSGVESWVIQVQTTSQGECL